MSPRAAALNGHGGAPDKTVNPATLVRRFPLAGFVLLACIFGWVPYLIAFLTGGSGAENLPLGPFFAMLVVGSCQGGEELWAWGRRIRSWRASPAGPAPRTPAVMSALQRRTTTGGSDGA